MMRLNFTSLSDPLQKTVGSGGTGGTVSNHKVFRRPTQPVNAGDRVGQGSTPAIGKQVELVETSHLSHLRQNTMGHCKPSIHAAVPLVPPVPPKKQIDEIDCEVLEERAAALAQFRFDLIDEEIAAGHPSSELHRANNLCWEIMQSDGLPFAQAMEMAAEIVVACPPASCEASYRDVWMLWQQCCHQV